MYEKFRGQRTKHAPIWAHLLSRCATHLKRTYLLQGHIWMHGCKIFHRSGWPTEHKPLQVWVNFHYSLEPDKSASFCIPLCWWSSLFAATIRDVWLILSFFNLGLFAACWVHFMCHHKLWPTSGSHPFSFLNNSLGHSYIITQLINGTRWFRERPLNLITHSLILWLFSLTVSTYKEKFTAICQQIFELGLAKHEERVAEKKMFWECVNDAKRENKEAGVTKIEEFMDYKKKVGVRINFLIVCSSAFSSSQKKKT